MDLGGRLAVLIVGKNYADIGQGAVALCIIEAVTDHPFVPDIEPHVIDINFDLGALSLAHQGAGLHGCGAMGVEYANQVLECVPRVDDILDDEDVLALDVAAHVHQKAHSARGSAAVAVAGHGNELDGAWNGQAPRYVGEED